MTRLQNNLILVVLTMFVKWSAGCVGTADKRPEAFPTASEETQPASGRPSPISRAATVPTGIAAPHPHNESPVKIKRVTGEMLEQAGATHVGQSIQDVPGVQPRR